MTSQKDALGNRKSRRLRRGDPEYEALENPELTFKQKTPQSGKKKSKTRRELSETESETNSEIEEIVAVSRHASKNGQDTIRRSEKTTVLNDKASEVVDNAFHETLFKVSNQTKNVTKELSASTSRQNRNGRTNAPEVNVEGPWNIYGLFSFVVGVVCISIGVYFFTGTHDNAGTVQKLNLPKLFPQQDAKLWRYINHGVDSSEPFVLLLVHDDKEGVTKCLARHVGKFVADSRTQRPTEPVFIDGKGHTTSNLLDLRLQIESESALILLNVDQLPVDSAELLHFILDVHEPWIPGAVYILTMNIPSISERPKNTFEAVHAHLSNKWSSQMKADSLEALITRISNFEYMVRDDIDSCL